MTVISQYDEDEQAIAQVGSNNPLHVQGLVSAFPVDPPREYEYERVEIPDGDAEDGVRTVKRVKALTVLGARTEYQYDDDGDLLRVVFVPGSEKSAPADDDGGADSPAEATPPTTPTADSSPVTAAPGTARS